MAGVSNVAPLAEQLPSSAPQGRRALLNPSHVATLLWMRWKLAIRGFSRGKVRGIITLVVLLVFVAPWLVGGAIATTAAYLRLPHILAEQVLFGVLAAIYLIWIALPLLQYTLNEGLDVTRLQIYPISRAELMVSLVLATFFDIGTLVIVLFYVPIVVGWSVNPLAGVITVLASVLAFVHTVGMSQLIMAALMGILRSRRFRDTAIIVFAAVGAACSVGGQFVGRLFAGGATADAIQSIRIDGYLQYTPPGMAARAIEQASIGNYGVSLLWLVVLAALAPVLLYIWGIVLERGITSAETSGPARGQRARNGQKVRAAAPVDARANGNAPLASPVLAGSTAVAASAASTVALPANGAVAAPVAERRWLLSPAALAITQKDLRYLWRDPQLKASLLSSLFLLVLILLPYGGGRASEPGLDLSPFRVLFASLPTLVVTLNLSLNALGLERRGLQMLFLFPVRPLDIFWGKNLAVGGITVVAQVVLSIALAIITGGWFYVPLALAAGVSATLVLMGCGNVTSVLIPFRVREMRQGRSGLSSDNALLRAVLSMVTMVIVVMLLIPVAIAIGVPLALHQNAWFVFTLPLVVLYGIGLHQVATRAIAPALLARAPNILDATIRE